MPGVQAGRVFNVQVAPDIYSATHTEQLEGAMDGPAHYTRAEELAEHAENLIEASGLAPVWAALAQVHATLANAAATAVGTSAQDARAWADVAGTRFSGRG